MNEFQSMMTKGLAFGGIGVLMSRKTQISKKGNPLYFIKVGNMGWGEELMVDEEVFKKLPPDETPVFVRGTLRKEGFSYFLNNVEVTQSK